MGAGCCKSNVEDQSNVKKITVKPKGRFEIHACNQICD